MNRAYSVLEIKSFDDDQRIITGIATSPKTDRMGDIVESDGAEYTLPLPLLWQHRSGDPIGNVTKAKVTAKGIEITAKIESIEEPGELKNLLDKAWQSIKLGLVRGLSIGFRSIESADIDGSYWAQRFIKWEWLELSAVTIPANVEATIQTVKSYDTGEPAATGTAARGKPPGASGRKIDLSPPKAKGTMTITERIAAFEAKRAANVARMNAITEKVTAEGRSKDGPEQDEWNTLTSEIGTIDGELKDLRVLEGFNRGSAAPVDGTGTRAASESRAGDSKPAVISVKPNVQKGIGFARAAIALLASKGNRYEALEVARQRWPDHPEVQHVLKAAVAAGTTTDSTWAGPLAPVTPLASEFLELLRPATLLGKLSGRMRQVPFNVSVPAATSGGSVAWVGQGNAKPLTALAFSTTTLDFAKASGIVVLTQELIRLSTPSAEQTVRDTMVDTMRVFMDTQFIDSTIAAVANVNPASITNGVTGFAATGTTEATARADLRALIKSFSTNNFPLAGLVLIMAEDVAFTLGTMVNAVGEPAFPGINVDGGNILGIPVITSNVVGAQIVAAHAPSILYADEGQTEIDVSDQASVQMDSAPDNPTSSATVMVSLWQRNLVGLRFERYSTWKKARTNSVNRITSVAYA